MKPLERIFFQACVMKTLLNEERNISFRDIVNAFSDLGFPYKRLWYYLDKWFGRGFYDYGVTGDLGWFYPDKFVGEYEAMYNKIIIERRSKK